MKNLFILMLCLTTTVLSYAHETFVEKIYVSPGSVYVAPEAIYVYIDGSLCEVNGITKDANGIYINQETRMIYCLKCKQHHDTRQRCLKN
jgi:hypothetical protein